MYAVLSLRHSCLNPRDACPSYSPLATILKKNKNKKKHTNKKRQKQVTKKFSKSKKPRVGMELS